MEMDAAVTRLLLVMTYELIVSTHDLSSPTNLPNLLNAQLSLHLRGNFNDYFLILSRDLYYIFSKLELQCGT